MVPVKRTQPGAAKRPRPPLVVLMLWACLVLLVPGTTWAETPTIVFMTDFGIIDDSVAICKGVMYEIAPDARIVDLTHQVTPYSILDGARFLAGASPHFPAGTIFVTVVDPTVGSSRKAMIVKTKKGQYFVLPDNGLITLVEQRDGIEEIREVTNPDWMIGNRLSSTFHGRDIFSPVGAHLARGDDWTTVGAQLTEHVRLEIHSASLEKDGIRGEVIATDGPFGNLITNIDADLFGRLGYTAGEKVTILLGNRKITLPFVHTFSDVPRKQPLLYADSRGHMALAVNQGNFSRAYGIQPPLAIFLSARTPVTPTPVSGSKSNR